MDMPVVAWDYALLRTANSSTGRGEYRFPMYVQSNRCFVALSFRGTTANCILTVTGKKGSSKISGLLMLYDSTTGKTVKNWTISKNGPVYSGSKTATAKKGHLYKLSFSGKVYG